MPTDVVRKQRLGVLHLGHDEWHTGNTPPIVVPSAAPHGMDELENRSWQRDGVREGLRGSAACAHPPKGTARQGANEPSEMSW